jgi:putative endonuclease
MSSTKTWFVYLIECTDGCLYTGITVDLDARFKAHLQGRGARYMRLHAPLRMLAAEAHADRSAALKAEYRIKQLSSAEKRAYAAQMIVSTLPSAAP